MTASGSVLIVSGFAYDLTFARIPYQDPTAEMQERWLFHKEMAEKIILTGMAFFGIGCLRKAALWTIGLPKKPHNG